MPRARGPPPLFRAVCFSRARARPLFCCFLWPQSLLAAPAPLARACAPVRMAGLHSMCILCEYLYLTTPHVPFCFANCVVPPQSRTCSCVPTPKTKHAPPIPFHHMKRAGPPNYPCQSHLPKNQTSNPPVLGGPVPQTIQTILSPPLSSDPLRACFVCTLCFWRAWACALSVPRLFSVFRSLGEGAVLL